MRLLLSSIFLFFLNSLGAGSTDIEASHRGNRMLYLSYCMSLYVVAVIWWVEPVIWAGDLFFIRFRVNFFPFFRFFIFFHFVFCDCFVFVFVFVLFCFALLFWFFFSSLCRCFPFWTAWVQYFFQFVKIWLNYVIYKFFDFISAQFLLFILLLVFVGFILFYMVLNQFRNLL